MSESIGAGAVEWAAMQFAQITAVLEMDGPVA
jgi:hypothetical protein